jgi:hypothetical protein
MRRSRMLAALQRRADTLLETLKRQGVAPKAHHLRAELKSLEWAIPILIDHVRQADAALENDDA